MKKYFLHIFLIVFCITGFMLPVSAEWLEDFDGTKGSYADGYAECSMGEWYFVDAMIGALAQDQFLEGEYEDMETGRSARVQDGYVEMNFDKADGAGTVSFYQRTWDGDNPSTWYLDLSTDGGDNWTEVASGDTGPGGVHEHESVEVDETGDIRIRLRADDNDERVNFDRIIITDFVDEDVTLAPTFDPTPGSVFEPFDLTLESDTPDAEIWYTLDGTDPTEEENDPIEYVDPFEISETTTVKAYADAPDMEPSSVVTGEYEFPTDVSDIAELRDYAEEDGYFRLTGEATVTFRGSDRNQRFIQDDTAAMLIDDNNENIPWGEFDKGDVIENLTGSFSPFANMVQFVPASDAPLPSVVGFDEVDPTVVTIQDLLDDHDGDRMLQAMLIRVDDLEYVGGPDDTFEVTSTYTFEDTEENEIQIRLAHDNLDYVGEDVPEGPTNFIGVFSVWHDTMRIIPRNMDELSSISDWSLY